MFTRQLALVSAVAICLLAPSSSPASGQITRGEANRLAVDVLTLHIGGDVRGVILDRTDVEMQIVVRREWLAEHQPKLLRALPAGDAESGRQQLLERIDSWLNELRAQGTKPAPPPQNQDADATQTGETVELLRVLEAERDTYRQYVNDPRKLPPGEGTTQARQAAYRQLAARLDMWITELDGASANAVDGDDQSKQNRDELIRILERERGALADEEAGDNGQATPEFVRLRLSRADVRHVFAQNEMRRKLALAAFQVHLNDVETTPRLELQKRLAARDIDWQNSPADGLLLLEESRPQDDREWAARRAIYEYQFLRRLDFQGTGNVLVQTGGDAPPPNLAKLMQSLLNQQQASALGDLLEEPIFTGLDFGNLGAPRDPQAGIRKATRTAERLGIRGVRITRMTPDLARRQTTVEDRFLAKMPNGTWETIWLLTKALSAGDANQSDLDRIRQDPQVKQIVGLAEGLGLGGGQLDVALQFGAATMNAQQATDDEFYEFRDRYTKQLSGPPLQWK